MRLLIPVESIIQNKGGLILYNPETNEIEQQYVHNRDWIRCGWRGGIVYNDYIICTDWTHLHYFNIKKWEYEKSFTQQTFNDLHYLHIVKNKLYVVNTGIDAIEIFRNPLEPTFRRRIFLFDASKQFEKRKVDLRRKYNDKLKVKPHVAHPNCLCSNGKDIFVTCFGKSNTINTGQVVDLNNGGPILSSNYDCHDGLFYNNALYFTWTRQAKVLQVPEFSTAQLPTTPRVFIKLKRSGWWRGMAISKPMMYLFRSDGYRGKKTTASLAVINMKTKSVDFLKLPAVDGVYWDTIYQPNVYER